MNEEKRESLLKKIKEGLKDLEIVDTYEPIIKKYKKSLKILAYLNTISIAITFIGFILNVFLNLLGPFLLVVSWMFLFLILIVIDMFKRNFQSKSYFRHKFVSNSYFVNILFICFSIFLFFSNRATSRFPNIILLVFILFGCISSIICITTYGIILKKLNIFQRNF